MARVGLVAIFLCLALGIASSALAYPRPEAIVGSKPARAPSDSAPPSSYALFLPTIHAARSPNAPRLRITALYYDTTITGEPDEAFQVWNLGADTVSLLGWSVSDGTHTATFPDLAVPPQAGAWCAFSASAFRFTFTASPACESAELPFY